MASYNAIIIISLGVNRQKPMLFMCHNLKYLKFMKILKPTGKTNLWLK